jgi:succinate-semialdehyde dehydrogenase / glutarate-semialdehyde dehydrogenase
VDRAEFAYRVAGKLEESSDELAMVISSEVGKPLAESVGEVSVSASFFRWAAGQAPRVAGEVLASPDPSVALSTTRSPVGLVLAITPWNFPLAMVARKIAAPIALGCPIILKPSEKAPLSALYLARLMRDAGLPDGALSVLPMPPGPATDVLLSDDRVRHVSFTGSARAGAAIHKLLAGRPGVGWSAELGGHAPVLVLDDADVDAAVELITATKFRNAGQTCVAPNRIMVASEIYDCFCDRFIACVKNIVVGDWHDPRVTMGPVKGRDVAETVRRHIDDAVRRGAHVIEAEWSEPVDGDAENFLRPAVILNWTPEMLVAREETFGPVAPIRSCDSVDEMIDLANNTSYGLAAYVFGSNGRRLTSVVDRLEYGVVGVNQLNSAYANVPIGGWKNSGSGVESGQEGTDQYLRPKLIAAAATAPER